MGAKMVHNATIYYIVCYIRKYISISPAIAHSARHKPQWMHFIAKFSQNELFNFSLPRSIRLDVYQHKFYIVEWMNIPAAYTTEWKPIIPLLLFIIRVQSAPHTLHICALVHTQTYTACIFHIGCWPGCEYFICGIQKFLIKLITHIPIYSVDKINCSVLVHAINFFVYTNFA